MAHATPRKILHLDLDAFFCAVEEQHDSALVGKPFAVGGQPDQRGVVASCSYAARAFGVRSALPMSQAARRCPDLIIVPNRHSLYSDVSRQVMALLGEMTPYVEPISIDEAFLDVTLLDGAAEALARRLQKTIRDELDLPASLGVAANKLVAKIANNIGKAELQTDGPPNAIKVVPPGGEAAFLAPLPIRELWGVGPKTAEHLHALGIRTIGDIARWPSADLARRLGKLGADLARRAQGIDDRPIETERETKSISRETTFVRDTSDGDSLRRTLRKLSESVGRRLRRAELRGRTIHIKLRWADFTTLTRQVTLDHVTDRDHEVYQAALDLFGKNWPQGRAVRLIGVGVSGFEEESARQLGLWEAPPDEQPQSRLQSVLDDLRERFGDDAVQRASDLWEDDS